MLGVRVFSKLELEAERLIAIGWERRFYSIYKLVADYGFSVGRPALWLLLIPGLCAGLFYGVIQSWSNCASLPSGYSCQIDSELVANITKFTLLQGLPPLGFDRMSHDLRKLIFTTPNFDLVLMGVAILQKLLALAGWFLAALALRNMFKMK
jgi:hypothetical protein